MTNSIASRIADFLSDFPPFSLLERNHLIIIANEVRVMYFEQGKPIFKKDDKVHNYFYIVQKGAVDLQKVNSSQEPETIDKCDEGDIFGLRPLFAKENYQINAITDEESVIYAIPLEVFKPYAISNPRVGNFLMESFASNTRNPYSNEHRGKLISDEDVIDFKKEALFELQPIPIVKKMVTVSPETSIQKAAILMSNRKVGSVIVVEDEKPAGIVTDVDIRELVATGKIQIQNPISEVMNSPVICYRKGLTIAQAQLTMMKHNINHICITKDGTPNTKVKGIVSEHDIIVSQGNNPAVLMKAINRAGSTKKLKRIRNKIMILLDGYLKSNIPLTHTSNIIFELNDATIKRTIQRCLEKMEAPLPAKFAWMSLGSQGRKEQLLHTDQDNALVFEDVPEDQLEETRAYFLKLATKVTKRLNIIGYEFCPADMMARNPKYCLSLSEWKDQFSSWVTTSGNDEILLCQIFFDFDISYGEVKLTNSISDHIFDILKGNKNFLNRLAAQALRNPSPLGFFRQFLVEQDGEKKDLFDIKKRGIMPLTDAARLLILEHRVKNISNTSERFQKLAQLEPNNKEIYQACAYSSRALIKFRTKQGLKHKDNGRFINLEDLGKEDKIKLKRCFKTIKEIQELIKVRYDATYYL
ncbi:MAG: CBS domain-containing protein [Gramella sp.]|nr:CBS domain-containing protein [Christiangramia sp.]